jgi:hypothetical protein
MKTLARIIFAAMVVLLLGSMPGTAAHARHSGHGPRVGVGIWLGPGWGPGWRGPNYYPSYYQYYPAEPPIVIQQQPEVYVQPSPETEKQQIYWYYCKDPQGYYPYVKRCPNGWMKVVPSPPTPSSLPPE